MLILTQYHRLLVRKLFSLYNIYHHKAYKKTKLKEILSYCSDNIFLYKGMGTDINKYPIISKDTIHNNFHLFKFNRVTCNIGYTSGTTGTPGKFIRDIRSMAAEQYYLENYYKNKGLTKIVLRNGTFNTKKNIIYKAYPLINQIFVANLHLNDQTMETLVHKLNKYPNKSLWAYPSSAFTLAEFCLRTNSNLDFDKVTTSSENLLPHQIEIIEKAFDCSIKDMYGQAERVAAFYRCPFGHYHEVDNYSYVEYLPVYGDLYEIIGTTLHNKVMPLIRYKTSDLVELSSSPCECGSTSPNIIKIHGRKGDMIELPSGKVSSAPLSAIFKRVNHIKQSQIIQKKDKSIVIKIVKSNLFNLEDEDFLINKIKKVIPLNICQIEYVDQIEKSLIGKSRFIINETT